MRHSLETMRPQFNKITVALILIIFLCIGSGACVKNTSQPLIDFTKTRQVPAPAPVPWQGVNAYTEETYTINTRVGQDFAVGILIIGPDTFGRVSYDTDSVISLIESEVVSYGAELPDGYEQYYGTEWFLFRTTGKGNVQLRLDYPLGYIKLYEITVE